MFTKECYNCGYTVRNAETVRVPVVDGHIGGCDRVRYFGLSCVPDYIRVEIDRNGVEHYVREVVSTKEHAPKPRKRR